MNNDSSLLLLCVAFISNAGHLKHQTKRCVTLDWWFECPTSSLECSWVLGDILGGWFVSHKLFCRVFVHCVIEIVNINIRASIWFCMTVSSFIASWISWISVTWKCIHALCSSHYLKVFNKSSSPHINGTACGQLYVYIYMYLCGTYVIVACTIAFVILTIIPTYWRSLSHKRI